jgi:hypothetical protein
MRVVLKKSVSRALLDGHNLGVGVHWRPQFGALFFCEITSIEPHTPNPSLKTAVRAQKALLVKNKYIISLTSSGHTI